MNNPCLYLKIIWIVTLCEKIRNIYSTMKKWLNNVWYIYKIIRQPLKIMILKNILKHRKMWYTKWKAYEVIDIKHNSKFVRLYVCVSILIEIQQLQHRKKTKRNYNKAVAVVIFGIGIISNLIFVTHYPTNFIKWTNTTLIIKKHKHSLQKWPTYRPLVSFFSNTVDILNLISLRCTTYWLDSYTPYKVITLISLVPSWHHT